MTEHLRLDGLQADESLFHLLVDRVQDYAIFALNADGTIASWNRGAEGLKGYSSSEVIGRHFSLFYTEEDREAGRPAANLRAAVAEGRVEDEGWRVRKDGSRFWANVVITALRSDDGDLLGFAKVTRDLTERRAAEEALRDRERKLRDTQRLAGLGSWDWDPVADRVTWTEELHELYGVGPESFGATLEAYLERVHPGDRERVRATIETAFREGGPFEFEERIVRPDGEVRTLRSRGRAVQDETGHTVRMGGACLDITDAKQAQAQAIELAGEQAARAAAEATTARLRFLLRASELLASSLEYEATVRTVAELAVPEVADWCAVDLVEDGGALRRVAVAHSDPAKVELARRLGERYPPARDAELGAWHVIHTGRSEYYPDIPDELLASAIRDEEQLALARELGLRSAITVPLSGRSGVLGVLTLVQAESGRRLSENDLRIAEELGRHAALAIENARLHRRLEAQNARLSEQTEELEAQAHHLEDLMAELEVTNEALQERTHEAERANQAKSAFLATMSHELRTPLNAIIGYTDLLAMGVTGPITDQQGQQLGRITAGAKHLLQLIDEVLTFSRIEAGRMEVHLVQTDLGALVGDTAALIAPLAEEKGLRFRYDASAEPTTVLTDEGKVRQILINLLGNAIKFTDAGEVCLRAWTDGGEIIFQVADTGIGIASEEMDQIFEPFQQASRGTTRQAGGTGLGLSVCRQIARLLGGDVIAESTPGAGSTFTVRLPRRSPNTAEERGE
ncbi:MAG TPA: PAS domain S-box protein [Longimicrobiaceae bacterium]|nr:PAS domain S-box protein [Longimicrobiaceae bacterium]